jgi:hypothetical protein
MGTELSDFLTRLSAEADNLAAFTRDPEGMMERFALSEGQKMAVRSMDVAQIRAMLVLERLPQDSADAPQDTTKPQDSPEPEEPPEIHDTPLPEEEPEIHDSPGIHDDPIVDVAE